MEDSAAELINKNNNYYRWLSDPGRRALPSHLLFPFTCQQQRLKSLRHCSGPNGTCWGDGKAAVKKGGGGRVETRDRFGNVRRAAAGPLPWGRAALPAASPAPLASPDRAAPPRRWRGPACRCPRAAVGNRREPRAPAQPSAAEAAALSQEHWFRFSFCSFLVFFSPRGSAAVANKAPLAPLRGEGAAGVRSSPRSSAAGARSCQLRGGGK